MTFWEHFLRLLIRKPKPALAALYWHLTRRKVRARNRLRVASVNLPFAYAVWIGNNEDSCQLVRTSNQTIDGWDWRPRFAVLLHDTTDEAQELLYRSISSVERQIYPRWTLIHEPLAYLTNETAAATADFVVLLRIGDELSEAALFRLAEALQGDPDAAILYGDEDQVDERGRRCRPWFKPRWNEEMFLAQDYLSAGAAIKLALAKGAAKSSRSISELLLTATAQAKGLIVHVPHILCRVAHRPDEQIDRLPVVDRRVQAIGGSCVPGPFGTIKVQWPLPDALPVVSIIVPTKDKLSLLQACVESVLEQTEYQDFEILIVDNASVETRTAEYLAAITKNPKVRVLTYDGAYNFSAINNFAVQETLGTYLCLLNNDTEVVSVEWLTEMMRYATRSDIGAVGAKLLYEDGTIQHAGVVVGIGEAAGHAHRFLPADQPGYFRQPHVAQFVSAVTAACLVVEKRKFDAVGGLDEAGLAVAFNDVDLCLKLEAAGWRNVYVPHAVLVHHESKSRGKDISPENIDRYRRELSVLQKRWGTKTYNDPLHNPNLDRYSETFVFSL